MYFDYTGSGSCFQTLSIAGKAGRNECRPKDGCSRENICEMRLPNDRRPNNDRCSDSDRRRDNDRCSDSDRRRDNYCCSDNDRRRDNDHRDRFGDKCHDEDNGKPFPPQQCCDNGDCCKDGTAAVLAMAMRALGRNDIVDIEITLSGGYTQMITLGRGGSAIISGDIIRTPQGAISVCEITKIRVIASSANDPEYMERLQNELENFIRRCMRRQKSCDFDNSGCDSCVEALQNYIMRNSDDIDALLFDGSQAVTAQVITGTTSEQVVESAELTIESGSFVTSAELSTDTAEVVTGITASTDEVVTEIEVLPASVVSAVTTETVEASAPVIVTDTEVVSAVAVTETAEFASDVTVTSSFAIGSVTTETTEVVSGFGEPVTVDGVISGIEAVEAVDVTAFNIPIITAAGTGALQVVIPAGAFGTNIPPADITLDVTAGGAGISFGGSATAYGLTGETTLLGAVEGTPAVSDISTFGTAIITEAVTAVTADAAEVVESIAFTPVSGALATDVTTIEIGSAAAAETVTVVTSVTSEFTDINGVGEVTAQPADELITTDTVAVISAAELTVETANAVTSAELESSEVSVISDVTTAPVTVASPTFAEEINGEIIGARCGIVAVDNTDGDISIYSSCSIRGTQTEAEEQ